MAKIKLDDDSYQLYKHRVYFPHFIGTFWVIPLIMAALMIVGNDAEAAWFNVCGVVATASVMVAIFSSIMAAIEENLMKYLFSYKLIGEKPRPKGFDRNLIDHPVYQEVLREYMKGEYIEDMSPLNVEIRRSANRGGSDIVRRIAEQLKIENDAMDEVKKITGG